MVDNINIDKTQELQVDSLELGEALKHFNWGAAGFTWIWGLGNGSIKKTWPYILLDVVPMIPILNYLSFIAFLAGIGLRIYYGLKGNEWAYENRAWWSLIDFTETQKRWAYLTLSCVFGFVLIFIGAMVTSLSLFLPMFGVH